MFQKLLCWLGFHRRPPADQVTAYALSRGVRIRLLDMPEGRWGHVRFVVTFRCTECGREVLE